MKILIIGFGSIAKKHINALNSIVKNVEIIALRSSIKSPPHENIRSIYSLDDAPNDVDFAIISNPTSMHYQTIKDLTSLRIPLFIEKPVLSSNFGIEHLVKILKEYQTMTYVACNLRFHPVIEFLKKEMSIRRPIEFNVYCGSFLPYWRPDQDYRNSYSAKKELGGGVHLDLIHEIDYTVYLLGLPFNSNKYISKKSSLEICSADIAHYTLEYQNCSAFITLNYYRRDAKREIECVWEDDTWTIDLLKNIVTNSKNEIVYNVKFNIQDTYSAQMKYFLTCKKNGTQPMNSFYEAIKILKICTDE